jgi:AcrR family transcriptional regulator
MERENQRVVITRRMLKESMLKILKEKDLDSISVAELCREAGINRATFYRHYEIPRDVLTEIQRDFYKEMKQQTNMPKSPEDIRTAVEKLCVFLNDHQDLIRIFIRNNSDKDFINFVNELYSEAAKEYSRMNIQEKLSQEDIQFLTLYNVGGSYFVIKNWIMGSIRKKPAEMADYVYDLVRKTEGLIMTTVSGKMNH